MADLDSVLPGFDLKPWRHLTFSMNKKNVTTAELITLDPMIIARRCPLPLKEVRRMSSAVKQALVASLAQPEGVDGAQFDGSADGRAFSQLSKTAPVVKTLDSTIDAYLGGGFPTGSICEIVGESGVGKTQFVLSLLLTAQLPVPEGLERNVMYISTEGRLNTTRLIQILRHHPHYQNLLPSQRPNLDRILVVEAPTFDLQENIIQYRLADMVKAKDVGFIVIDSIAANFRVAFQGASPKVLVERAIALGKLGDKLRKIAIDLEVAVVLTNQVSDRFEEGKNMQSRVRMARSEQPQIPNANTYAGKSMTTATQPNAQTSSSRSSMPVPLMSQAKHDNLLSLDYQQQFFTGWGHDPDTLMTKFKNPTLGLSWASQLNMRVVLKFENAQASHSMKLEDDGKRARCIQVAFSAIGPPHHVNLEYELLIEGPRAVEGQQWSTDTDADLSWNQNHVPAEASEGSISDDDAAFLDPKYWSDDDIS